MRRALANIVGMEEELDSDRGTIEVLREIAGTGLIYGLVALRDQVNAP